MVLEATEYLVSSADTNGANVFGLSK
uniref:Uncharacterized protein n=1 Tax=Arundo donax TaxID=35708 RepID=A0A0A9B2L9_ARUDO